MAWWSELYPGYEDSLDERAPSLDRIGQHEAAIRFAAGHVPFIARHESRALTPIAIEPFEGDWHTGADIYRSAWEAWMELPPPPTWASEPHSWLQLHIN